MHKILIERVERDVIFVSLLKRKDFWIFHWFKRIDWFYHQDNDLVWAQVERWKKQHVVVWIDDQTN